MIYQALFYYYIGADETPEHTDNAEDFSKIKPVGPPTPGTPEYKGLQEFCNEVEIIVHVVNDRELRAGLTFMKPPCEQYDRPVNNFPYPRMVVGMFAGKKAALVQTDPGNACRSKIKEAIQAFENAKYVLLVGVCYAFSQDKKLGDVLVSKKISDFETFKFNPDGSVQNRGNTLPMDGFLIGTFCNNAIHNPPFRVSDKRQSKVHCGDFISFSALMNNKKMRDEVHKQHDYAIAGEMEGGIVLEFEFESQTKQKNTPVKKKYIYFI